MKIQELEYCWKYHLTRVNKREGEGQASFFSSEELREIFINQVGRMIFTVYCIKWNGLGPDLFHSSQNSFFFSFLFFFSTFFGLFQIEFFESFLTYITWTTKEMELSKFPLENSLSNNPFSQYSQPAIAYRELPLWPRPLHLTIPVLSLGTLSSKIPSSSILNHWFRSSYLFW